MPHYVIRYYVISISTLFYSTLFYSTLFYCIHVEIWGTSGPWIVCGGWPACFLRGGG